LEVGDSYRPTHRTTLRRLPGRAAYDRGTVHAILDEALVAHLAVMTDLGPRIVPTTYARVDELLYLHGSAANHLLRSAASEVEMCMAVTLLDGLVLARSAFHHSMNYRSVVVYGWARRVTDDVEKRAALDAIVDRVVPGRTLEARPPTEAELRSTLVLALPLVEVSAKVRTGGPIDDEADLGWPAWAGVIPVSLVPGAPVPA
jgi:nitroimidazol reductase NimA-like FMN-containing flavoprotein (pyridoxamine 5'-phosphate oxidase superfamily)